MSLLGRLGIATALAVAMAASARGVERDQTKDGDPIRILATGSFLGQFDGFVMHPGHSRDEGAQEGLRPYGGLLGAIDAIAARRAASSSGVTDFLLIAGDNASHGYAGLIRGEASSSFAPSKEFWAKLAGLNPTAVALWSEDFLRALAPSGASAAPPAGLFAAHVAKKGVPFLASNAAIRIHGERLNKIEDSGIELEIDPDVSVGWVEKLSLRFDCDRRDLAYVLVADSVQAGSGKLESAGKDDPCHAEIELEEPLKPGRPYQLAVTSAGHRVANLSFRTDAALTPHHDKMPAIVPGTVTHPVILSLVDPAIRDLLPQTSWEWEPLLPDLNCPGEKCEIVFNDPSDSFQLLRAWLAPQGQRYFALMAGVTDADAAALLAEEGASAIKFVILSADSGLLGEGASERAAGMPQIPNPPANLPKPPYAGDWGNVGVLDGPVPPAARAWVRAQWIGANVATIEGSIAARMPTPADADGKPLAPEWDVNGLRASSVAVPGYRICAQADDGQQVIRYRAAAHDVITKPLQLSSQHGFDLAIANRYRAYAPDRTYDDRHEQGKLWIDRGEFAAMALDRMRRELSAEIALFPKHTVDEDYLAVLAAEHKAGRALNWLSREIVNRALFRADRVVRAKVAGSKLAATLQAIVDTDDGFCAAGLNSTSCGLTKIDADHLRVNGRKVQPDHFYGVAMPAGLAASLHFEDVDKTRSLIDLIDAGLLRESAGAVDTCSAATQPNAAPAAAVEALGARLESEHADGAQGYYLFKPFGFDFSMTELSEPDIENYRGTFSTLPLAGSKADDQVRWAIDGGIDAGVDWRKFVLHGIATLKYGKSRVHPHTAAGPVKTVDPDEYTFGGRFDWKAFPGPKEGRFFAGVFEEGELSRELFFAGGGTPEPTNTPKRKYRYMTFGGEVDDPWTIGTLAIKQIRAAISRGTSYDERTHIRINDGAPTLLSESIPDILEGLKEKDDAFEAKTLTFDLIDVQRTRGELEALVELPLYESNSREGKLTFNTKYFYYWDTRTPLQTFIVRHNATGKVEVSLPLWRVFDAAISLENQRVWLRDRKLYSVVRSTVGIKWPLFGKRGSGIIW